MSTSKQEKSGGDGESSFSLSLSRIPTLVLADPKTLKPWSVGLAAFMKANNLDEVTGLSPLYPCLRKHEKRFASITESEKGKAQLASLDERQRVLLRLTEDAIESKYEAELALGGARRSTVTTRTAEAKTEEEKRAEAEKAAEEARKREREHVAKLQADRSRLKRAVAAILGTVDTDSRELLSETLPHPQVMWEVLWDHVDRVPPGASNA